MLFPDCSSPHVACQPLTRKTQVAIHGHSPYFRCLNVIWCSWPQMVFNTWALLCWHLLGWHTHLVELFKCAKCAKQVPCISSALNDAGRTGSLLACCLLLRVCPNTGTQLIIQEETSGSKNKCPIPLLTLVPSPRWQSVSLENVIHLLLRAHIDDREETATSMQPSQQMVEY